MPKDSNPFHKPPVLKKSRRAKFHDYAGIGYYHITASAIDNSIPLSSMPKVDIKRLKSGEMIIPDHSELGELIRAEIRSIPKFHPKLTINRFVIMPDHTHFVVYVKERLNKKLGNELAGFFGACSRHYSRIRGYDHIETLFHPHHDNILFDKVQLARAVRYVEDNPRRLIIKRKFPELFKKYLHIKISEWEFAAFGNIFLLRAIFLLPVRIHRRWSDREMLEYENKCRIEIENGAIPISPAIHPIEKRILSIATDLQRPVIRLTDKSFGEKFKPSGKEFDLCASGQLLLLAPFNDKAKHKSGYKEFHDMNDMALAISNLLASTRCSIVSFLKGKSF